MGPDRAREGSVREARDPPPRAAHGLIPPVNLWGLDFSHAFGGFALYVEVIFGLPGIGQLTSETMGGLDLPPIVAITIYLTIVVVLVSAIVDMVIAWLDPQIRRAGLLT